MPDDRAGACVRSRYQLEYQQAQDIMDGRPPQPEHDIAMEDRPRLQQNLQTLARVAAHLRAGRLQVLTEEHGMRLTSNTFGLLSPGLPLHHLSMMADGS